MGIDLKELEEKYSKNKPTFSPKELLICIALIVGGCVIFSFMPAKMGIFGWVLFAVGAFLNIVGIFRLAAMTSEVKDEPGKRIVLMISLVAAFIIQFIGLLYLYTSRGTGKAMAITTFTLCVSLGLVVYAVDFDDENMKKKIVIASRIITVCLIAIAILLNVINGFSKPSVYVGTILVIEAVITGRIGFRSNK